MVMLFKIYSMKIDNQLGQELLNRRLSVNKYGYVTLTTGKPIEIFSPYRNEMITIRPREFIHRIVWMYYHGDIPDKMEIDHINDDKKDNTLENLQLVTHKENCRKRPHNRKNKKSKYHGVSIITFHNGKKKYQYYIAQIKVDDDQYKRKIFPFTAEGEIEAARQYDAWAKENFGKYVMLNF